jgi:hypothetical protein
VTDDDALWDELLAVSKAYIDEKEPLPFREAYRRVARCLSLCHRLGVEQPGVELLGRDAFEKRELDAFFQRVWRLATLQAEQREINIIEARRGVDRDSADFASLREQLNEARQMILAFGWLPEDRKRRSLDGLALLQAELQKARDDFDVAFAEVRDPLRARAVEIGRRGGWLSMLNRVAAFLGPARVDEKALGRANAPSLPPPPRPDEDA